MRIDAQMCERYGFAETYRTSIFSDRAFSHLLVVFRTLVEFGDAECIDFSAPVAGGKSKMVVESARLAGD